MFSGQVEINAGDGARKPAHHAFAERIWREAAPIGDTLAKAYLEARGIRAVSRALRFHPRTPLGPRGNTQYLPAMRSEEHTSELQSLMRISYAVFCLKKKKKKQPTNIYKKHITHNDDEISKQK